VVFGLSGVALANLISAAALFDPGAGFHDRLGPHFERKIALMSMA